MKYNLANKIEVERATTYLELLAKRKQVAEVKVVRPGRSLNQNSYLHLLLGYFGQHFGYTLDEAKILYKREVNDGIYVYKKNDRAFLRSSADLDSAEMTKTIDRFKEFSKEQGLPLPAAENEEELRSIENEMEKAGYYL